jgi:predicted DNA-binding transcriptional regulator AlpA
MPQPAFSKEVRPHGLPILMTTGDVAELLHVDASTLCRWRQSGTGPRAVWLTRHMPRYKRADVMAWVERMAS